MKKLMVALLIMSIMFTSCVTRPVTESDYRNVNGNSLWAVWIPGVTQMINGELLKGALMLSSFALINGIAGQYRNSDGEAIQGSELEYNLLMGSSLAVLAGSVVDGVMTTNVLKNQRVDVDIESAISRLNELGMPMPTNLEHIDLTNDSYTAKNQYLLSLKNEIAIAERFNQQNVKSYEQIRNEFEYELTAIKENLIFIGMNRDALIRSIGGPTVINTTVGTWGTHEQFVYRREYGNDLYVYLENGSVTSWQY